MSFLLLATAVAVAAGAAGAFIARRSTAAKEEPPPPPAPAGPAPPKGLETLPITLGDVVSVDTPAAREERWLEAVILARDGAEIVGAVFVAPEGSKAEAVVAFAQPRKQIGWLSPVTLEGLSSGTAELPSTLEIGGAPMRRRARIPVTLERSGKGAPSIGDRGVWAEYEATGRAVAIVIQGSAATLAWSGMLCEPGQYERMGSGVAT